jgi:hypothetical protein
VIALGTNDTANVSVGSPAGPMARIQEMMSAAHGQPVMWVNVKTLDSGGPWAESNMRLWNAALHQSGPIIAGRIPGMPDLPAKPVFHAKPVTRQCRHKAPMTCRWQTLVIILRLRCVIFR